MRDSRVRSGFENIWCNNEVDKKGDGRLTESGKTGEKKVRFRAKKAPGRRRGTQLRDEVKIEQLPRKKQMLRSEVGVMSTAKIGGAR